jgi:hypothetical protein
MMINITLMIKRWNILLIRLWKIGRDQQVNEMTIKPHIRGFFCLWDDG